MGFYDKEQRVQLVQLRPKRGLAGLGGHMTVNRYGVTIRYTPQYGQLAPQGKHSALLCTLLCSPLPPRLSAHTPCIPSEFII